MSRLRRPPPPPSVSTCPPMDLPPATPPFDWQQIWSFFLNTPRVRAWLFERTAPLKAHVVQALLSSPILVGYVFSDLHIPSRSYSFPDIGDLHTVFCRDGDALLGFSFGFQGRNPVMPLLFQVIRDPMLGNPNVIVRKTAKQRAPRPYQDYYLCIEFNWLESGALGVVTSITSSDSNENTPSGRCSFVLQSEHRVFNRRSAAKLSAMADQLSPYISHASLPHLSPFHTLPPDFADPPDDYHMLIVKEYDDSDYHALDPLSLNPASKNQVFEVESDFAVPSTAANSTTTTTTTATNISHTESTHNSNPTELQGHTPFLGGALLHCHKGDGSSVAEAETVKLWRHYQGAVDKCRRTGNLMTMLGTKVGGRFAKEVPVYGRDARYRFLSTSGVNVHGRIQQLFSQLDIQFGSPHPGPNSKLYTRQLECSDSLSEALVEDHKVDLAGGDRSLATAGGMSSGFSPNMVEDFEVVDAVGGTRYERGANERRWGPSSSSDQAVGVQNDREPLHNGDERIRKRRRTTDVNGVTRLSASRHSAVPLPTGFVQMPFQPAQQDADSPRKMYIKQEQVATILPSLRNSCDLTNILSNDTLSISVNPAGIENRGWSAAAVATSATLSHGSHGGSKEEPTFTSQAEQNQCTQGVETKAVETAKRDTGTKAVWTCHRCGQKIRGKKGNLNRHIANKHDNIRAYECTRPNCDRKFQTRLNLVRHDTAVHLGRPYTCPKCPRAFKNEVDLAAHVRAAHKNSQLSLACKVCGSCFGRRSTLNRHMAKVHKVEGKVENTGVSLVM
ncbi:unnamed protein product [Chondrus crispus]|uniref:C2H2-type domain-containing protein n=1 Tax=Chondrus crispus TaxID=2769 RepID=R7Q9H5_CHOCR|nr:unnamed protein product [Chondrus crispus]CDF34709.1 unnamed protein product [Chondrus crispus]|eukprot:XP_005714528.1 unnamed protein product [Chondrus crispus]